MNWQNITKGRGDDGTTDLCMGKSVSKCDSRINVVGDIDEFHATLGLCHEFLDCRERDNLLKIQRTLTKLMGEISCDDDKKSSYLEKFGGISQNDIDDLNNYKDIIADELNVSKQLDTFKWSLYGERGPASARLDYSGTVCRRCERQLVSLSNEYSVRSEIVVYMNRLSKVLYLLARFYEKIN